MEIEVEIMNQKTYTGTCTCPGIVEGKIAIFKEGKEYKKDDIVILNVFVTQNVMLLRNAGGDIAPCSSTSPKAASIAA